MDADCIERPRDQVLSRREKRWSMNSQRLEEIVAELMKPISDARRSFDTDLSALLEEYLTEAGLHALDAGDAGEDSSAADLVAPNFAELALLLQQSANIYGRKVDFLYQHVLDVSDSLHNCTQDLNNSVGSEEAPGTAGPPGEAARRRRRAPSAGSSFALVALEASSAARREAARPRPPPTLPRPYLELEPRDLTPADAPLHDYAGEPIGLLADFQLAWRLHEGFLVDDLEVGTCSTERALQPLSLVELQEAIAAAAPPLSPAGSGPLRASTPLAAPDTPHTPDRPDIPDTPGIPDSPGIPDTPGIPDSPGIPDTSGVPDDVCNSPLITLKKERKRKSNPKIDNITWGNLRIVVGEDLRQKLNAVQEFSIPSKWIKRVVDKRKSHILSERRRLREQESKLRSGYAGWSSAEGAAATEALAANETRAAEPDSDDDGFFEQSSVGDSDASRAEEPAATRSGAAPAPEPGAAGPAWDVWQAEVVRSAAAAAARGAPDVRRLGAAVLRALAGAGGAGGAAPPALPCPLLLRRAARAPADVSHLLLATLFLANSGNVEVIRGQPLTLNTFSLRLVSADERLYSAAAAEASEASGTSGASGASEAAGAAPPPR